MSILQLNTIKSYHDFIGIDTINELISVIDFQQEVGEIPHALKNFGFYSVILKGIDCGTLAYGRQKYDYQSGTLVFLSPGQVIGNPDGGTFYPQGYALLFHSDLLLSTSLKNKMLSYTFFTYQTSEALHLSQEERTEVLAYFHQIKEAIAQGKSTEELVFLLEHFLEKCQLFYERQFATRSEMNKDILSRFERILEDFYTQNELPNLPNVNYFADKLFLSTNYFGDLIKKETGKAPKDYIHFKIIDLAKTLLLTTDKNINEIAYQLGFEYPHYFGRLFKKIVGTTPNAYRKEKKQ